MTSAFSWQNSISICPALFCTPRPNLPAAAAAATKSLHPCLTLSDPMDYSLPGPPSMGFSRKEYGSGVPLPSLRPSSTNTQKRCNFHYRGLECKSRSQESPGVTHKFVLGVHNEAGQRLIEFCQKNTLVIANSLFHKSRLYT